MQDFRNLRAWRAARELRRQVYDVSRQFPAEERYALTAQLRDAASSVMRNLAEGCGRQSDADFARFVHHALGSLFETEDALIQALDCGLLDEERFKELEARVCEVRRMLCALLRRLRAS